MCKGCPSGTAPSSKQDSFAVQNNDYTDVDEVEDYLRRANPAYKRRPQAQFRKVVERAVQTVQREGGPIKPELRFQVNYPLQITTFVIPIPASSSRQCKSHSSSVSTR